MKTGSRTARVLLEAVELEVPLGTGGTLVLNCAKGQAASAVDQGRLHTLDHFLKKSEAEFAPGLVSNLPMGSLRGFRSLTTFRAHFDNLMQALLMDRQITLKQRPRWLVSSGEPVAFFAWSVTSQVQSGQKLQACMLEVTPRADVGRLLRMDFRQEFRQGEAVVAGAYYVPLPGPAYALRVDMTPPARDSNLSAGHVVLRNGDIIMLEGCRTAVTPPLLRKARSSSHTPVSGRPTLPRSGRTPRSEKVVLLRASILATETEVANHPDVESESRP